MPKRKPKGKTLTPIAINLDDQVLLCQEGVILPITNWIDEDGEDCEQEEATCFVAGTEEHGYVTCLLHEYTTGYLQ